MPLFDFRQFLTNREKIGEGGPAWLGDLVYGVVLLETDKEAILFPSIKL